MDNVYLGRHYDVMTVDWRKSGQFDPVKMSSMMLIKLSGTLCI